MSGVSSLGRQSGCAAVLPIATVQPVEEQESMQRIVTLDDIARGLDALCVIDPRLQKVRGMAGEVPLRLSEPGFRSLASIVVSQQVSRASAVAIFGRLT